MRISHMINIYPLPFLLTNNKDCIIAYSYELPFLQSSGDEIRIKSIHELLRSSTLKSIICFCLGDEHSISKIDDIYYVQFPRLANNEIKKFLRIFNSEILEEVLRKLTQLMLDEPLLVLRTITCVRQRQIVIVHGDMSVAPFMLRLLRYKGIVVFDSLANYAQTLYIKIRRNKFIKKFANYIRLGLYLIIYRSSLGNSNSILYPSRVDASNAQKMFRIDQKRIAIIPNVFPVVYENMSEYKKLRKEYRRKLCIQANCEDLSTVMIFTPGGRVQCNQEALNILRNLNIDKFSNTNKILLVVTGPWKDYRNKMKIPSIFPGVVGLQELKGLLAAADVGLAPIFEGSGTQLKVLGYIASGLTIVATPIALQGLPPNWLKSFCRHVYTASDAQDFIVKTYEASHKSQNTAKKGQTVVTKDFATKIYRIYSNNILELIRQTSEKKEGKSKQRSIAHEVN